MIVLLPSRSTVAMSSRKAATSQVNSPNTNNSHSDPAAVSASSPSPVVIPPNYSADRSETEIRQLKSALSTLRRSIECGRAGTVQDRMRVKEIEKEITDKRTERNTHTAHAQRDGTHQVTVMR